MGGEKGRDARQSSAGDVWYGQETVKRSALWCARQLEEGHLLVLPTETVYGLAASPWHRESIEKLYTIKQRPSAMPLILHYGSYEAALEDVCDNAVAWRLAEAFMPGPLTLILPAVWPCRLKGMTEADPLFPTRKTLAVRVPSHPFFQEVAHRFSGPIAASSANISGQKPLEDPHELRQLFSPLGIEVIALEPSPLGLASTIISLEDPAHPCLLRQGSLSRQQIESVLQMPLMVHSASCAPL